VVVSAPKNSRHIATIVQRTVVLQVGLVVIVTLVAAGSSVAYRSLDSDVQSAQRSLLGLQELNTKVSEAQAGLRGYALTGDVAELEPYRVNIIGPGSHVAELRQALPARQDEIDAIAVLFDEYEAYGSEVLVLLASNRRGDAVVLIASGRGRDVITNVKAIVDGISAAVERDLDGQRRVAASAGVVATVTAVGAVVAAIALGVGLRRRLQRGVVAPLVELADAAEAIGAGDLSARSSARGSVEIEALTTSFNDMAARNEATVTELRALDKMKSEFVSIVSHELRTPLTSIRGSLGLLQSNVFGELPPDAAGMLNIAVANTDRLVRLINDILDLQRIESGSSTIDLRSVSSAQLVDDAVANVAGTATEAEVVLDVVDRPDIVLDADADHIVQALTNLLGNAIKFSDAGGSVVIDVERRGAQVVFAVRDEGRGIPGDKLEQIFERFEQVDASDSREKGGTGLGLAIVRSIARRHGGEIEVESTIGVGSEFRLVLPARGAIAPAVVQPVARPGRVLAAIVEDDADLCAVLAAALARHDIDVVTASTATDAVARIRASPPDVLVLDVRLLEGDGFDVARALRQDDLLRHLPTVVYTVQDLDAAERARLALGETIYVAKGTSGVDELERIVLSLIER
jgi:signal transduction histidine kinase/CheY-like chemotaxis protein